MVDVQDVLHRRHELSVPVRWNAPLSLQMWFPLTFFKQRRTVSSEIASTTSNSTSLSASSCMVHSLRPSGGFEQASAVSRASARPSSFRGRLDRSWACGPKPPPTPA